MATVTFSIGHIADGDELLVKALSPAPPFRKANAQILKHYIVGTDFTSGDDVVLQIPGITKALVVATTNVGAIKAYVEAADSTGTGKKFTFSSVTTNLKVFIITDI